ncbi:hypothetical protein ACFC1R_35625 [Kitasatospora sp. NPDC056138]|uniref:hypothetical protein n=1 Tax=Kitasatospora sp. NPDC056138 TaxID=3345724 RepID=UPI0035DAF1C5
MCSVAARLGVAAMSPYRYVNSKDELVHLMADAVFGEEGIRSGWRVRPELGSRTLWGIYRRRPWLAQVGSLTRPLMLPAPMVHAEWALSALDGHGLDPTTMLDLHVLLYSYVQGIAGLARPGLNRSSRTLRSEGNFSERQINGRR